MFWFRDPLKFVDLVHSRRKDPGTNLKNASNLWDFISLLPETTYQNTINYSDRGTPDVIGIFMPMELIHLDG